VNMAVSMRAMNYRSARLRQDARRDASKCPRRYAPLSQFSPHS
jgi:hypothetical protein